MQRTVAEFSLRADADVDLQEMRQIVERSIGCPLTEKILHGSEAFTARLFGMQIIFGLWYGLDGKSTFQLHGLANDPRLLEGTTGDSPLRIIDISNVVIDLLEINGASNWRTPSAAEIDAEIAYDQQRRKTGDD